MNIHGEYTQHHPGEDSADTSHGHSGLRDARPGCELALLAVDPQKNPEGIDQYILGYWKIKAVHDGGLELSDEANHMRVWLVLDEYGQADHNRSEPS